MLRSCLCCGPIYAGHTLQLGESVEPGPAGGPGSIIRVALAATGVGAGLVLAAVPTGAMWRWIAGFTLYTATATVGTRSVRHRWRDASGNVFMRNAALAPTAGQSADTQFAPNMTTDQTLALEFGNTDSEYPSPASYLPAGYDFFVLDGASIDVLDTDSLEAQVEEWVIPS